MHCGVLWRNPLTEVIRNKQLAKILSERSNGSYFTYEILDFLELFPRVIEELILEGNEVRWTNFGSFAPKYSKPRVMTSGLTGKDYEVPAGMTMKFVVSPAFREELKRKFKEQGEVK